MSGNDHLVKAEELLERAQRALSVASEEESPLHAAVLQARAAQIHSLAALAQAHTALGVALRGSE